MSAIVYRSTIKELPPNERPRERLIAFGASSLTDAELLALIISTGSKSETAVDLARRMLQNFPLKELIQVEVPELIKIQGVGEAKAARIKATVELAARLAQVSLWDRPVIQGPEHVAQLVMEEMRHFKKEYFRSVMLDTKNRVVRISDIHIGTANASLVHPREVYREAIRLSATSCIVVHNHPSGDPTPSDEDIAITRRLAEAGDIVGIDLLDHVIIGDRTYLSLKQKGIL